MCTTPVKQKKKNVAKTTLGNKTKHKTKKARSLLFRSPQASVQLTVDPCIAKKPSSPLLRTFEEPQSVIASLCSTRESAFFDLEGDLRTTLQRVTDEASTPSADIGNFEKTFENSMEKLFKLFQKKGADGNSTTEAQK